MKKYSLFSVLLRYIWLLGTFTNSSCDIKINIKIVQNCCRNLAVRGLRLLTALLLCEKKAAQMMANSLYLTFKITQSAFEKLAEPAVA